MKSDYQTQAPTIFTAVYDGDKDAFRITDRGETAAQEDHSQSGHQRGRPTTSIRIVIS